MCEAHPGAFQLCLPESFEWMILKSGVVPMPEENLEGILQNPVDWIESRDFFSWENFFEDYLVQHTKGTPFQYTKSTLNGIYKQEKNCRRIAAVILDVRSKPKV